MSLGNMDRDGGLRFDVELVSFGLSDEARFRLSVSHHLVQRFDRKVESEWRVSQLCAYCLPYGRKGLRFLLPGGREILIDRIPALGEVVSGGGAVKVERGSEADVLRVLSHDGWTYGYRGASLVSMSHASGVQLEVEGADGRIDRIQLVMAGRRTLLAKAVYMVSGNRIHSLESRGRRYTFEYNSEGRLAYVRSGADDAAIVSVAYEAKLVSSISEGRGQPEPVIWKWKPNWRRGDFREALPIQLSAMGDCRYRFEDAYGVVRLERIANGQIRFLRYNKRTGIVYTDSEGGGR